MHIVHCKQNHFIEMKRLSKELKHTSLIAKLSIKAGKIEFPTKIPVGRGMGALQRKEFI